MAEYTKRVPMPDENLLIEVRGRALCLEFSTRWLILELVRRYEANISKPSDVVEVVRCKNCVHFIPDEFLDHTEYPNDLEADGLCDNIDKYTDGDRYCSSGVKMDGKDDNR